MDNYENVYSVYVKLSSENYIELIDSSYQISPVPGDGWVKIDEGTGVRYALAGTNYVDDIPLQTFGGAWKYKLINGSIEKCGTDELIYQESKIDENIRRQREEMERTSISMDELIDGYADHEYRLCMLELFGEEEI